MASGLIYDDDGRDITMDALDEALDSMWMSPDCWAGKHAPSCTGGAWDEDADAPTGCQCPCHEDYEPESWQDEGPPVVDVPTGPYL